jgi:hypothetical protein
MGDIWSRWQHTYFYKTAGSRPGPRGPDLNDALMEAYDEANKLGAEGWEMVSFTTQWVGPGQTKTALGPVHTGYWLVVCFMKRPGSP